MKRARETLGILAIIASSFCFIGCPTSSGKTATTTPKISKKQLRQERKEKKQELKAALEALPEKWKQFLKDVEPIMDENVRKEFLELQRDVDREKFEKKFWALLSIGMRTPTAFKDEYNVRLGMIRDAQERPNFERPAWTRAIGAKFLIDKTRDPGRIFLMNGPPQFVQSVECDDILWPIQIWEYDYLPSIKMHKVKFLFYRPNNFDYQLWLPRDTPQVLFAHPPSLNQRDTVQEIMRCIEWRDVQTAINTTTAQLGDMNAEMTVQKLIEPPKIDPENLENIKFMSTDLEKGAPSLPNVKFFGVHFTVGVGNANKTKVELSFTIPREALTVQELEGTRQYHIDVVFEALDEVEYKERVDVQNQPWDPNDLKANENKAKNIQKQLLAKRFRFDRPADDGLTGALPIDLEEEVYPGEYTFVAKFIDVNDKSSASSVEDQAKKTPSRQARWEQKIDVLYVAARASEPAETSSVSTPEVSESAREEDSNQSPVVLVGAPPKKPAPKEGASSLIILYPTKNPALGLTKFDTIIADDLLPFVARVDFFATTGESLEGEKPVATKHKHPFSLELDMGSIPRRYLIRAVAFDRNGGELARDEITVNRGGSQRATVRIISPTELRVSGKTKVQVTVSIPENRTLKYVDFYMDNDRVVRVNREPWIATVNIKKDVLAVLRVVATFDDDTIAAEDSRPVNAGRGAEGIATTVNVDPIELYIVVKDGDAIVRDLKQSDFEIFEDGVPRTIETFEYAKNSPIAVGIAVDTSGSMEESLLEVQKAAIGFINTLFRENDTGFTLEFNRAPIMLSPLTGDKQKLTRSLTGVRAEQSTAFYDAVARSLYEFQGVNGKRALVILTDGDDRSSSYDFATALEYAKRAGVAIYTIGFRVRDPQTKAKLTEFAKVSGGRAYFVNNADELKGAYKETELELRSQYVITYPRPISKTKVWRKIEVRLKSKKFKVRTIPGYYP